MYAHNTKDKQKNLPYLTAQTKPWFGTPFTPLAGAIFLQPRSLHGAVHEATRVSECQKLKT